MSAYCEAGFDPANFWNLTPREIAAHLDGAARRLRREHNNRAWLAWHAAALTRVKQMPKLESLMSVDRPEQSQTWEDMLAVVKSIHVAAGGDLE